MSDAEETLMLEIHETKQNAQETWLHVRCSKMLDALGALKVEHAAALSRARAEALEGVAKTAERPIHPVRRAVESIAGDLGVDLSAEGNNHE